MKPEDTGRTIRERRKRLGIGQRALAEIAGVSEHSIVNLEAGRGNPTLKLLDAVLTALGLELVLRVRQPGVDTEPPDVGDD